MKLEITGAVLIRDGEEWKCSVLCTDMDSTLRKIMNNSLAEFLPPMHELDTPLQTCGIQCTFTAENPLDALALAGKYLTAAAESLRGDSTFDPVKAVAT